MVNVSHIKYFPVTIVSETLVFSITGCSTTIAYISFRGKPKIASTLVTAIWLLRSSKACATHCLTSATCDNGALPHVLVLSRVFNVTKFLYHVRIRQVKLRHTVVEERRLRIAGRRAGRGGRGRGAAAAPLSHDVDLLVSVLGHRRSTLPLLSHEAARHRDAGISPHAPA